MQHVAYSMQCMILEHAACSMQHAVYAGSRVRRPALLRLPRRRRVLAARTRLIPVRAPPPDAPRSRGGGGGGGGGARAVRRPARGSVLFGGTPPANGPRCHRWILSVASETSLTRRLDPSGALARSPSACCKKKREKKRARRRRDDWAVGGRAGDAARALAAVREPRGRGTLACAGRERRRGSARSVVVR